jgi:aspartate aminotransferase
MISEVCEKYSHKYGRPIWIISDDVYCRVLRPDKKSHQIFKFYKFSVIIYSVSKDTSLPGERIGALIMNPEIKLCERNIHAISMSNEFMAIYPPNRLHMRALPKLLKYTSKVEYYTEGQEIVEETLKKLKIEYVKPEGAFYVFPKIPEGIDEMDFCKLMVENFIVVVPGSAFGAKGFYRVSFCKVPEDIKKGMEQFEKAYAKVIDELKNAEKKVKDNNGNEPGKKFPETNKFIYC